MGKYLCDMLVWGLLGKYLRPKNDITESYGREIFWQLKLGLLQEQKEFLTVGPFLQTLDIFSFLEIHHTGYTNLHFASSSAFIFFGTVILNKDGILL